MPQPATDADRLLRAFVAVARSGSLASAGFALGLTAAAVSRQIAALEVHIGTRLFDHHGRGMRPTSTGAQLLRQVSAGFDLLDAALAEAQGAEGQRQAQVRIASVNTLAAYLLPEVARRIRDRHPQRLLQLLNASSPDVVELVARGNADLGLVYDLAVDTGAVRVQRLFAEDLCAFCRADERLPEAIDSAALLQQPLIVPPRPYALRRLLDKTFGAGLRAMIESNSVSLSLDLAARGLGLALLPTRLPEAMVRAHGLRRVRIAGVDLRRPVVLIHRPAPAELPPAARETMQLIEACTAAWRDTGET